MHRVDTFQGSALLPRLLLPLPRDSWPERLLITGGAGYLGRILTEATYDRRLAWASWDLEHGDDCRDQDALDRAVHDWSPTAIVHLAAHKHAAMGEMFPAAVADLNVRGTEVVARVAHRYGVPFVVASTCKAADPATAYGASKLIAERVAAHYGGAALRLVNVLGSSGSVLPIWGRQHAVGEPLQVTRCWRMWMTGGEAALALVACLGLRGTFVPEVGPSEPVSRLAERAYPGHPQQPLPLRRGDRERERLVAEGEVLRGSGIPGLARVVQQWEDPDQPEKEDRP